MFEGGGVFGLLWGHAFGLGGCRGRFQTCPYLRRRLRGGLGCCVGLAWGCFLGFRVILTLGRGLGTSRKYVHWDGLCWGKGGIPGDGGMGRGISRDGLGRRLRRRGGSRSLGKHRACPSVGKHVNDDLGESALTADGEGP